MATKSGKSEKTKRQELLQSNVWVRTFKDNHPKDMLRLVSFLPNMGANDYLGSAASQMIRVMIKDNSIYNEHHHQIFEALLQAVAKNPKHLEYIYLYLIEPNNAWFLQGHIQGVASVFVSAYENLKPTWRPKIFEWLMSNVRYIEAARNLGFNPEQALYEVDTKSYHDWFSGTAFGVAHDRHVVSWFTGSALDVEPDKMQDPDFLYTLILKQATSDEKAKLWEYASGRVDLQQHYVRALLSCEGLNFNPLPLLPVFKRHPPTILFWGLMLRAVDCCPYQHDARLGDPYNYHIYKDTWPLEMTWLHNMRHVEKGLGDLESPFKGFIMRTDWAFFEKYGAVVEQQWSTNAHMSHTPLPFEFDMT